MNEINLKGRTAIVTGAAQGFGLAITKRYLKSGAKVIMWDIDEEYLRKSYREINNSMIARSPDTEFIRLISGTHQISTAFDRAGIKEGDKKAWIIYLPNLEVNNQLDKTNLPRDVFNNNTDQAENLILHLEASLITLRPMPIKESLNRLEIAITKNNLTPLEIENYLLNHAAMADLHS